MFVCVLIPCHYLRWHDDVQNKDDGEAIFAFFSASPHLSLFFLLFLFVFSSLRFVSLAINIVVSRPL